jgi:DNA-binding SARP family transcriptional activator
VTEAPSVVLELLGGFRALGPDGTVLSFRSTKDEALLACIALSTGATLTRDALTGLLWSTRAEEQARASLRQALWGIKKTLGPDADDILLVDRRTIALRDGAFVTDAARFEQLTGHGEVQSLRAATELYAGDLLDGVTVRDPAWEEWLLPRRERLRTAMTQVLARLCVLLLESGDVSEAAHTAARLLVEDPLHEDGHRTLMQAYLLDDQRGMALKQYEICREALHHELGIAPAAETETLRRRLAMPVLDVGPEHEDGASVRAPAKPSVVVLPFAGRSNDADEDAIASGITESVTMALTRFRNLFVIGYKTARLAGDDVTEFGAQLGVQYAVEGSVRRAGGRFRVTAELVSIPQGERVWAEQFDRESDDLLAVEDELSERIVVTLVGRIEDVARRRLASKRPEDMVAYELVLLGRDRLNRYTRAGEHEARTYFERALELEPEYAAALAGLAVSYGHEYESTWSEDPDAALAKAYELGCKAVELDEFDSMASYSLASAYFYRKQYELANLQIERAIQINPLDYHNLCSKGWFLTFSGQVTEGIACSAEAMSRNPLTPDNCLFTVGVGEFILGRYEEALLAFGRMGANTLFKQGWLAACYAKLGRGEEARTAAGDFLEIAAGEFPSNGEREQPPWQRYWSNQMCFLDDSDRDQFFEALRSAGLPI